MIKGRKCSRNKQGIRKAQRPETQSEDIVACPCNVKLLTRFLWCSSKMGCLLSMLQALFSVVQTIFAMRLLEPIA